MCRNSYSRLERWKRLLKHWKMPEMLMHFKKLVLGLSTLFWGCDHVKIILEPIQQHCTLAKKCRVAVVPTGWWLVVGLRLWVWVECVPQSADAHHWSRPGWESRSWAQSVSCPPHHLWAQNLAWVRCLNFNRTWYLSDRAVPLLDSFIVVACSIVTLVIPDG